MDIKKCINNNTGAVLSIVIIIFVILSLLIGGGLAIMSSETNQAQGSYDKMQAYYLAKSGADAVASYIITNPDNLNLTATPDPMQSKIDAMINGNGGISDPVQFASTDQGNFTVQVERTGADKVTITSTGTVKSNITSTVQLVLKHVEIDIGDLDSAVYFGDTIEVDTSSANSKVNGKAVGTGSNPHWDQDTEDNITGGVTPIPKEFIMPPFPVYPNLTPDIDTNPSTFSPGHNYTNGLALGSGTIPVNTDTVIRTASLTTNQTKIEVASGCKLKIYIDSGSKVNLDHTEINGDVEIFYDGGSSQYDIFNIGTSCSINADMYIRSYAITRENNGDFFGHLIYLGTGPRTSTDEGVHLENNGEFGSDTKPSLVYAPYDNVYLDGSMNVNGVVISNSFTLSEPAKATYYQCDNGDLLDSLKNTYYRQTYK